MACDRCKHRYCGHGGNYKAPALLDESLVTAILSAADPACYVDELSCARAVSCPGCLVQVCAEVVDADLAIEAEMYLS